METPDPENRNHVVLCLHRVEAGTFGELAQSFRCEERPVPGKVKAAPNSQTAQKKRIDGTDIRRFAEEQSAWLEDRLHLFQEDLGIRNMLDNVAGVHAVERSRANIDFVEHTVNHCMTFAPRQGGRVLVGVQAHGFECAGMILLE